SIDTRRLRSKTASASDTTRALARNAACSQNAGSPTGPPSGGEVGAVEIGPVVATGGGADETPVAAPGGSISGWYPHAARETARATSGSRTGRRTAGRYGFRSARGPAPSRGERPGVAPHGAR